MTSVEGSVVGADGNAVAETPQERKESDRHAALDTFERQKSNLASSRRLAATTKRRSSISSMEEVLLELNRRLRVCEEYVGAPDFNWATSLDQMRQELERQLDACFAGDCTARAEVTSCLEPAVDSSQTDWVARVKESIHPQFPLALQLRNLSTLTETIYGGNDELRELQAKTDALKVLLQSENNNVPHMLLSMRAKRAYVLENAASIQEAAARLQQLEELIPYCNWNSELNVEQHKDRLLHLEQKGLQLTRQAARIYKELEELSISYNAAMTITASFLDGLEISSRSPTPKVPQT